MEDSIRLVRDEEAGSGHEFGIAWMGDVWEVGEVGNEGESEIIKLMIDV